MINRNEKIGWGVYWLGVAFVLACFGLAMASCNDGRNHGSNIPIDPYDVCAEEGVEDCCPDCEACETCEVCTEPETVYLCKKRIKACARTWQWGNNCPRTGGHDDDCEEYCEWVSVWEPCDGPE